MKVIITALNEKGRKAIKEINKEEHKLMSLEGDNLIVTIPKHLSPFIRMIKNKFGVTPQYEGFITQMMYKHGATGKDYTLKVE